MDKIVEWKLEEERLVQARNKLQARLEELEPKVAGLHEQLPKFVNASGKK